jgi:cell division protease FtsH
MIETAHDQAWDILVEYRDVLDNLVLQLMEKETLYRAQVLDIFASVVVKEHRPSYAGYGKRLPSDRPPILTPKELSSNGSLTVGHQDALPSGDGA